MKRLATYRVLRKLAPRPAIEPLAGVTVRQGLFVDAETTGLDPVRDEIIELAMVPFTYGLDGQVYAVGEPFQQLREPSKPIPAEITAITGIDHAMVAGKRIDPGDAVAHAAAPACPGGGPQRRFRPAIPRAVLRDVQYQAVGLLDERSRLGG